MSAMGIFPPQSLTIVPRSLSNRRFASRITFHVIDLQLTLSVSASGADETAFLKYQQSAALGTLACHADRTVRNNAGLGYCRGFLACSFLVGC